MWKPRQLAVATAMTDSVAAVRTIFMGNIASPALGVSPLTALKALWNGEMPLLQSAEEMEALANTLISGLWNQLADHQDRRSPFRLTREPMPVTRTALRALALTRAQELAGFVDGFFGEADEIDLPEKAHQAIMRLGELHSMFNAAAVMLADETKPATQRDLAAFTGNAQDMTRIAEESINKAIQSCKRARAGHLETMAAQSTSRNLVSAESDEPVFVKSPLSQQITRNGVAVEVEIYGDGSGHWILEVVDRQGTSHVWDEHFSTDQEALAEAISALDEEPMEFIGEPTGEHDVH